MTKSEAVRLVRESVRRMTHRINRGGALHDRRALLEAQWKQRLYDAAADADRVARNGHVSGDALAPTRALSALACVRGVARALADECAAYDPGLSRCGARHLCLCDAFVARREAARILLDGKVA